MNVTCPECRSMFRVDPSKVSSSGVRARCSVCGGVITIGAGTSIDEEFDGETAMAKETPVRAPEVIDTHRPPTPPTPASLEIAPPDVIESPREETPALAHAAVRADPPPVATQVASQTPVAVDPRAVEATSISPKSETAAVSAPPAGAPAAPVTAARQTPPVPQPAGLRPPPPFARAPLTPPASVPGVQRLAGSPSVLPPVPPARSPLPPRPSGVGPLAASRPNASPSTPPVGPSGPPFRTEPAASRPTPAARTPINPFLANDPNAKARRLSRALVSDLVTYFPQRRDEGIRDGTLKDLFRDEIKKSYEEYVDQVGKEFADSTTHFQDALNEILAAGNKVF